VKTFKTNEKKKPSQVLRGKIALGGGPAKITRVKEGTRSPPRVGGIWNRRYHPGHTKKLNKKKKKPWGKKKKGARGRKRVGKGKLRAALFEETLGTQGRKKGEEGRKKEGSGKGKKSPTKKEAARISKLPKSLGAERGRDQKKEEARKGALKNERKEIEGPQVCPPGESLLKGRRSSGKKKGNWMRQ